MKKIRSRLAIILAMTMVITSFTFVGVFAEDLPEGAAPAAAGESADLVSPDQEVNSAPAQKDGETEAPAPVSNLQAFCSCNSIVLLWDVVDDPSVKFLVDGEEVDPVLYTPYQSNEVKNRYDIKGLSEGQYRNATVETYRVDENGEKVTSGDPQSAHAWAVQTIRYRVKVKKGTTLKAHGGNGPRSIRVSKGQYLDCYGFGGGKYIFNYGGSIFYCNKSRTSKRTCLYHPSFNYSRQEAEFFINTNGVYSSTNSLIWVNTYSQHLYRFAWVDRQWRCVNDFECSTGKAATPSPTGVSGRKVIWKKIGKRHGIRYWSPYSDINSIHAKKAKWRIGYPSSNGCIRNYENNAYDVYVNAPIGTAVLLY